MKRLLLIFILLFGINESYAQLGDLLITSYTDTNEYVAICGSNRLNNLSLSFGLINLDFQNRKSLIIDSLTYSCDTTKFSGLFFPKRFDIGAQGIWTGINYHSNLSGFDTLYITAYYDFPKESHAIIVCKAEELPGIALLGYAKSIILFPGGFALKPLNLITRQDTLHDEFDKLFYPSVTPVTTGLNKAVKIVSCSEEIIDSILYSGDFSEFEFLNLPATPYQIKSKDTLTIFYNFIPNHIGTYPHFLIFHTISGKYLVWSFEYTVYPTQSVSYDLDKNEQLKLFPNPANSSSVLQWNNLKYIPQSVSIYNSLGLLVKSFQCHVSFLDNSIGGSAELNLSDLPIGQYNVVLSLKNNMTALKLLIIK